MVYCPKCNAPNRRGSRFCNECGEPLPMRTALRCPMCGTVNPVGNVHCDKCHARLIPMAAPGYGEPEREQAPTEEPAVSVAPPEQEREQPVEQVPTGVRPEEPVAEDWLAQLRASAAEEAEAPDVIEEPIEPVEMPDWLRDMGPVSVETRVEPREPAPAETPGWLREAAPPEGVGPEAAPPPVEAVPEEAVPAAVPPTPAEIPDWLREIAPPEAAAPAAAPPPVEAVPEEAVPTAPPPTPGEIPDWLREIAPPERAAPEPALPPVEAVPQEAVPAAAPPTPAEIPDWLREIAPPEAAAPAAAPPPVEAVPEEAVPTAPPPTPGEIPDWLREIAPPAAAAPAAAPPPVEAVPEEAVPTAPPPTPGEIPDWLREIAPPERAAPEPALPPVEAVPEEAVPAAVPSTPAEIPDWLREIAPPEGAAPEAVPPIAPERAPPGAVPSVPPLAELPAEAGAPEVPAWLAGFQAKPAPPSAPTTPVFEGIPPRPAAEPETGIGAVEGLAPAAIPDWLEDLRPRQEIPVPVAEEEPMETEGLLEGLRGVLTPPSAFKVPAVREHAPPPGVSQASLARAELLQTLLARPAEALRPQARQRGVSTGERVQRWLVAAVLLIAAGSILIAPLIPLNVPALTQLTPSYRVITAHSTIQDLSAGDSVLVAFEYGPAEADELDLVAAPAVRHVLDQGAQISVVSTRPEGLAMAEGLLNTIQGPEGQYTQAYRPGDATGVSQLLADASVRPGLILVLTAQPGPLRWWVEQARALYGDTVPVVAGMSAALESTASPYLDASARQIEGAINGLSGAAAYETLYGSPQRATQRLNALAVGHLAIVGLMILGAAFYTLGGLRGREGNA